MARNYQDLMDVDYKDMSAKELATVRAHEDAATRQGMQAAEDARARATGTASRTIGRDGRPV